jgi:hypothetical protein
VAIAEVFYRCPSCDNLPVRAGDDHPPLRRTATGTVHHIPRRDDPVTARCGRDLFRHGHRRERFQRPAWCRACEITNRAD